MNELSRLKGALLTPYHLGRMTTYTLMGALVASLSAPVMAHNDFRWITALLLAVAGASFLVASIRGLQSSFSILPGYMRTRMQWNGTLARWGGKMTKGLFLSPVGWRGYALGLILGLLPCGLVYAALMAATTTGSAFAGAFGMMAFATGTIPALVGVGLGGAAILGRWRDRLKLAARGVMVLNGVALLVMAGQQMVT